MQRNVFSSFGEVAMLLTVAVALTLSALRLSCAVGTLKCYDVTAVSLRPVRLRVSLLSLSSNLEAAPLGRPSFLGLS